MPQARTGNVAVQLSSLICWMVHSARTHCLFRAYDERPSRGRLRKSFLRLSASCLSLFLLLSFLYFHCHKTGLLVQRHLPRSCITWETYTGPQSAVVQHSARLCI
ncbi:hypothetical protein K402DRAFT_109565 [Aulographum hederae CBS 113979]|uniref:Uncharacterized protein n=1 Tax=Aulographum hederae CBS 113979 TaxID=1176131 RepID=A0A6G1GXB2_9PEZI|nr:hypothetical protein K402DRAFT_109565 [Aulographum hederae CBS 113979]